MKNLIFGVPLIFCTSFYSIKDKDMFKNATIGIYMQDIKSKEILMDVNADKSMDPASLIKVITTKCALDEFGEDFTFETKLIQEGVVDDRGVLHEDLRILGGGDPTLGSRRNLGNLSEEEVLSKWVEAIKDAGIEKIRGDVIVDATIFEKKLAAPSWYFEDLGNYYGAGASGISFLENYYTVVFQQSHEIGEKVSIVRTEPLVPHLIIENEVVVGPEGSGDRAYVFGMEYSNHQVIRGSIPPGSGEFKIKALIPNTKEYIKEKLVNSIEVIPEEKKENGHQTISEDQNAKASDKTFDKTMDHTSSNKLDRISPPIQLVKTKKVLHTISSPSLKKIVNETNKKSVNLYAEHLIKLLGKGELKAGCNKLYSFMESKGIDMQGALIADGGGLSRKNLLTPRQMGQFLVAEHKSKTFKKSFVQSGRLCYKTGTKSEIKNLVGYLTTPTGKELVFAIFINNFNGDKKEAFNKMLSFLYNYRG